MLDHRIGGLPVVDSGALVGIITLTDCVEALLHLVESRPARPAELEGDAALPMDAGDERPGRPPTRPVALVVHHEDAARLDEGRRLRAQGYKVVTCPGPLGGTACPGMEGTAAERCPRVPADVDYIVLDQETARTPVGDAYRSWAPAAEIHVEGAGA
jgi:hypothetical protein